MRDSKVVQLEKSRIRKLIWTILEEKKISRFPKPIFGRIPNFIGSEQAAERLASTEIFRRANVIFANPDSPQRKVREISLVEGKTIIMATPRLRKGFIILDPRKIPSAFIKKASTIRGAFKFGRLVDDLSGYSIDLKLLGSVAVWKDGARVGKGGGYSDLEYAILRENGWISEITPLVTTVHDLQLYKEIPMCEHDVPIDYIITPSKIIKTELKYKKPKGIYWDILTQEKLSSIPLLQRLWKQDNALMRKENHFL